MWFILNFTIKFLSQWVNFRHMCCRNGTPCSSHSHTLYWNSSWARMDRIISVRVSASPADGGINEYITDKSIHLQLPLLGLYQWKCTTCGKSSKYSTFKYCPDPDLIQTHLQSTTRFEGTITPNHKVCLDCCLAHLTILKLNSEKLESTDDYPKYHSENYTTIYHTPSLPQMIF